MIEFGKAKIVKMESPYLKSNKMTINSQIKDLVKKLANRVEYEVSDSIAYRNISENFKVKNNDIYAKAVALTVSQDEVNKAEHMLEISALHPSMNIEATRPLVCGNKKAIIDYLKDNNNNVKIREFLEDMSQGLKNK